MSDPPASLIKHLVRQPSLWIALMIWCLLSAAAILLCRNGVPLDRPELAGTPPITEVLNNSIGLFLIILLTGMVSLSGASSSVSQPCRTRSGAGHRMA